MLCPACKTVNLAMTDRQGIEIDYCPECRGIWLDRGELDRLIERAEREAQPAPVARDRPPQRDRYDDDRHHPRHGKGYDDHGYRHKKRKSLLGELLDF
jgi:Zn-finger nucleic acid-binding protein